MTRTPGVVASLYVSTSFATRPMKLTCLLVLVLSLVVQPISDAKKLVQEPEEEAKEDEKTEETKTSEPDEDEAATEKMPCSVQRCGTGWAPKLDHHKLKGSSSKECCRKTCALYECPDGYKPNDKYHLNIVEANDSSHACCDMLCSAYTCNAGFLVRGERRDMLAESHDFCCDISCASFPCTGTWNKKKNPHLRIGHEVAECCDPSCEMWNCTGTWERKEEVLHKSGTSDEECCWQDCSKIETCPADHVNRTKANKTDGACCLPKCSLHNCSATFIKPLLLDEATDAFIATNDDAIGNSDEACCLETCKRHTCEGAWAHNPRSDDKAIVLDKPNGSANPFCCNPRCSLHVCNVSAGWSKDKTKDELEKEDDPSCCQKNCRLVPCAAGKALNILAADLVGKAMTETACCETQKCADFRVGKEPVSDCTKITGGDKCLQSYEMKTSGTARKLTACGFKIVNGESLGCVAKEVMQDGCGGRPPVTAAK